MSRSSVGVYRLAAAMYALLFFDVRRALDLDLERVAIDSTDQGEPIPALPHLWLLTTDSTETDGCFSGGAVLARGASFSSPYATGAAKWEPQPADATASGSEGGQV